MSLSSGTRLGPYEILGPLGAGGMGEVYRARDTRLDREVALKILPEHLSARAEARERFEREAKVISSLNHPHICTLYDVGEHQGSGYLVMELLDGESLAARLERGPMKPEEALKVAAQVADALDKAHRRGIVHRDLKPGNIMLTKAGAKILDFGVAKLQEEAAGGPGARTGSGILPTLAPTRTTPLTSGGAILGTMQYMAPEQLEGKPVDFRADLFAFGAVLYEMITGKRAFEGGSQASVIAAVLERDPRPASELAPASPPGLDRVIRRCLAKDPDERWQTAMDLKSELEWIAGAAAAPAPAPSAVPAPARRAMLVWVTATCALIGAAALVSLGWLLHRPAPVPVMRTSIVLPKGTSLDTDNCSIALSPDGTRLAYAARQQGGPLKLWVRPLSSLTAQPLAGTEGATYPFWSPDGTQIGFFADGRLKKVQASGGASLSICPAEDGRGASWGKGDVIVFSPRPFGGLFQAPASGGTPAALTTAESESITHRNPHFLPDGRRVLYFSGKPSKGPANGIYIVDLGTKKSHLVTPADSEGLYVDPGYLAYVREGNLVVQRFDLSSEKVSGDAIPIAENVQFNSFRWTGTYSFSSTGLLLYQNGAIQEIGRLTWYDLAGNRTGTVGEPALFWLSLKISPDGRRAATTVRHRDGGSDLWMFDLSRGLGSRFTLGETSALEPIWSPDGRQVAYDDGAGGLYVKASDGASPPKKVLQDAGGVLEAMAWSPDGNRIVYEGQTASTSLDLWTVTMTGEPKPEKFLATPASEEAAAFSPDGRWLTYLSNESGRTELYAISFPDRAGKWQISPEGARDGGWLGAGKEIWYRDLEGKFFAVAATPSGAGLVIGSRRPLFGGQVLPVAFGAFTPDGTRFLGAASVAGDSGAVLTLVTDWVSDLEKP